jgi:hypothetical protein
MAYARDMRNTFALVLLVVLAACSSAPDKLTFDGNALKKAQANKLAVGLEHVSYTEDGVDDHVREALHVLTVAWTDGDDAAALYEKNWSAPLSLEKWYVEKNCRVVRNIQNGRFGVATWSCSKVKGNSVCADWDEVVPMPCPNTNEDACKTAKGKELCAGRFDKFQADLDAVAKKVAR